MDEASLLYVSDDPEKFSDHGQLFDAQAASGVDRFLIDHVNGLTVPMRVMAFVSNVGSASATVSWFGATGAPDINGMAVGHAVTSKFLFSSETANGNAPSVDAIAPGSSLLLADAVLQPSQCFAAIFGLQIPADSDLYLRTLACDPSNTSPDVFSELPPAPDDGAGRRGVFVISDATTQVIAWSSGTIEMDIGRVEHTRSPDDPYQGPPLKGEYGIIRRFTCNLSNGAATPTTFALYGTPRAGSATSSLILDDECIASHSVASFDRFKILAGTLAPGENRTLQLSAMPDINSSYPFAFSIATDDQTVADAFSASSPLYTVT